MYIPTLFLGVLVPTSLLLCLVQPSSARPVVTAHANHLRWPHKERLARRAPPPAVQPSVRGSPARGRSQSLIQENALGGAGSGARDSHFNPISGLPVQPGRLKQRLIGDDTDPQNNPGHHSYPLPYRDTNPNQGVKHNWPLVPPRPLPATPPPSGAPHSPSPARWAHHQEIWLREKPAFQPKLPPIPELPEIKKAMTPSPNSPESQGSLGMKRMKPNPPAPPTFTWES